MADKPSQNGLENHIVELEKHNQALTNQNRFFELLISNLPGLFYLFDSDFIFHKWNKNLEAIAGLSAEEIPTRSLFEMFKGNDLVQIKKSIDDTFSKGSSCTEVSLRTRDERLIPYYFTGASTTLDNKKYLIGMGLDISKLKQAENSLRESEALYHILAERLTEGVILFHDFQILFVNKAFASMLGYAEPAQLINKNVMAMVAEGYNVYFREMFEVIQKAVCKERYFQARWVTLNKKEIWVEGRAILITWKEKKTILLTARDITESKLKELSLKEETESLRRENVNLRSSIKDRYRLGEIIGKSESMQKVYERILNAAASNANVIIYGESGTGKELVARAIHKLSRRSVKPFVPVNSSAIPMNLLESEFFGYQKGAFTGANADKQGYLDRADGGTLFLDEIGDLDIGLQAKFLRAIEDGGYSPVGSTITKHSDVRIISATHKNLLNQIKNGEMRQDFFYRIHIIPVNLPPLRERKDDIPLLVEHFFRIYAHESELRQLPGDVMKTLINYEYPGNVRELQNVIQRYLAVKSIDFLFENDSIPVEPVLNAIQPEPLNLYDNIDTIEKDMICKAMIKHRQNKSQAAESLGISRKTLARKLKMFQITEAIPGN